jgi:hypothetical protein
MYYSPYLDNIETLGRIKGSKKVDWTCCEKTKYNRQRSIKIVNKTHQNQRWRNQLQTYILNNSLTGKSLEYFTRLRYDLQNCCSNTLLRQHLKPNCYEFIGAQTCKNKLCNVCNYVRSKTVRRKYNTYFKQNEFVDKKTGEVLERKDLDFMHLTLTVPHTENKGWRGKQIYVTEIMAAFNKMRKMAFWQYHVFAGEFGVEFTKGANGLHIHIHSLIAVHKEMQNRNNLQKQILLAWNSLTVCPYSNRKAFDTESLTGIRKAFTNKAGEFRLSDTELKQLNPQGSTLIGIENLYYYSKKKLKTGDVFNTEKQMWKHYADPENIDDLMRGVMECIKYHFEPMCLMDDKNELNFDLIAELMPEIKGKPLYRKFGNWHGLSQLNIIEKASVTNADLINDLEETANENISHPETQAVSEKDSFVYVAVHAKCIYHDFTNNAKPKIKRSAKKTKFALGISVKQALTFLVKETVHNRRPKTKQEILVEASTPDVNKF